MPLAGPLPAGSIGNSSSTRAMLAPSPGLIQVGGHRPSNARPNCIRCSFCTINRGRSISTCVSGSAFRSLARSGDGLRLLKATIVKNLQRALVPVHVRDRPFGSAIRTVQVDCRGRFRPVPWSPPTHRPRSSRRGSATSCRIGVGASSANSEPTKANRARRVSATKWHIRPGGRRPQWAARLVVVAKSLGLDHLARRPCRRICRSLIQEERSLIRDFKFPDLKGSASAESPAKPGSLGFMRLGQGSI